MFKFETKPVMGKLHICVSKETRTIQKEQHQKRPLSGQKLKQQSNHRCSNSKNLHLRPRSTPQLSTINLDKKNWNATINTTTTVINNVIIENNKNSIDTISHCQNTDDTELVGTTIEQFVPKSIHTNDASTSSDPIECQTYSTNEEPKKTSIGCGTEGVDIVEPNEEKNFFKDVTTTAEQHSQPERINYLQESDETSKNSDNIPKRMSLLEQKRLQWAAEKEQMHEWNPWGRPGGGAPTFTYTCDTTKSNFSNTDRIFNNYSDDNISKHGGGGNGGRLPPLQHNSPNSNPTSFRILQAATFETMGLMDNSAVMENCPSYDVLKEKARRQWLEDLGMYEIERQREEQRVRKMQDKSYYHKNLNDMNIENTVNNFDSYSMNHQLTKNNETDIIASVLSPTLYSLESDNWNCNNSSSQRTFLRGANIPLDPETQKELTKKREMALEHQKAIQNQLEDRLRMKREEKERQRQEELEEESRLRQEREQLEHQFILDQQQQKPSPASPERGKCVQQKEVSQPPSKPQTRLSPQLPDVLDGTKQLEMKPRRVNPTEQDLNDSQVHLLRPPSINHTPYVNNRVLTPTKYREKRSHMRDFSTQTDFKPKATFPLRKNKSTITMKATSVDEDSDTNSNETSTNDRGKHRNKTKNTRKKLNREKPQWGANQPARNYKTQSEKYLSGEVKLNQRKAKEQQQEYVKIKAIRDDEEKVKRGQRPSGKKTRSSAEHQRKLLAQEEGVTLNSQRICLTPLPSVRPLATGSSVTHDERNTGESLPTRRQRRQWQSPSRDEMPAFYTDSPLLPDVRNVRRGITSNNGQSKDQQRRSTSQSMQGDTCQEPYRSDSPPVPALRNKLDNTNMERLCVKSPAAVSLGAKPKDRNLASGSVSDSIKVTEDIRPHNLNDETTSNISERLSRFSVNDAHRSSTAPSHIYSVSTSPTTSFTWQAQNYDHRIDILKKLTLVRQGLVLKQKQLEDMVVTEPKPKDSYS